MASASASTMTCGLTNDVVKIRGWHFSYASYHYSTAGDSVMKCLMPRQTVIPLSFEFADLWSLRLVSVAQLPLAIITTRSLRVCGPLLRLPAESSAPRVYKYYPRPPPTASFSAQRQIYTESITPIQDLTHSSLHILPFVTILQDEPYDSTPAQRHEQASPRTESCA
jgi:hypothetical protein